MKRRGGSRRALARARAALGEAAFARAALLVLAALAAAVSSDGRAAPPGHSRSVEVAAPGSSRLAPGTAPGRLSETGLYADAATHRVRRGNLPYSPQYPLWSDGAAKRRWIHLPPGTRIDASDPDRWAFPVGTKLWKEFSFEGRRVETRLMELQRDGTWLFAAYAWDAEGRDAVLAPARGIRDAYPIQEGVGHDIPGTSDCRACHEGRSPPVLGFTAIQLSPDRDPLAPHAEPVEPGFVDLATLVERRLVRGLTRSHLATPPRIPARTPVGRAALGYLQANCGVCHNATGPLASKGLALDHVSASTREEDEPALRTAVGQKSRFGSGGEEGLLRIAPGDPDRSVLTRRMAAYDAISRMPPIGTKLVDEEALALVRRWIQEDLDPGPASDGGQGQERGR